MSVTVDRVAAAIYGSCYACDRDTKAVTRIILSRGSGGIETRLCDFCRDELLEAL